jgi:hypothetical protein
MEQLATQDPKNAAIRFNLARVHAMAYALKMKPDQTTRVAKGGEASGVFFGPEAELIPFRNVPANDPAIAAEAKNHLTTALELYREGLALDSGNLLAKLGYAWCLDQSGDREKAITAYRHVIAEAWLQEQSFFRPPQSTGFGRGPAPISAPPNWHPVTVEAANYLIPLLDRDRDQDEIATLRERTSAFNSLGRAITPIAIPLHDGLSVSDLLDNSARVRFDADGSGIAKQWTWISPKAGWLVYLPDKSRGVTSALQLFGNATFWLFWDNGYDAMQVLDNDADGELKGSELDGLALWRDVNRNGISEPGEMRPLAAWGIVSLSWQHVSNSSRFDYAASAPRGVTFRDGHTRPTFDVILHLQPYVETSTD